MPTGKESPLLCVDVKLVTPQLSSEVGAVQVAMAAQALASLDRLMSAGMPAMDGASLSVTVMSKLAVVMLPASSVAV